MLQIKMEKVHLFFYQKYYNNSDWENKKFMRRNLFIIPKLGVCRKKVIFALG
jgi:hypothetical protein